MTEHLIQNVNPLTNNNRNEESDSSCVSLNEEKQDSMSRIDIPMIDITSEKNSNNTINEEIESINDLPTIDTSFNENTNNSTPKLNVSSNSISPTTVSSKPLNKTKSKNISRIPAFIPNNNNLNTKSNLNEINSNSNSNSKSNVEPMDLDTNLDSILDFDSNSNSNSNLNQNLNLNSNTIVDLVSSDEELYFSNEKNELTEAMKGKGCWSVARMNSYKLINETPNQYYLTFNKPNELLLTNKWKSFEKKQFMERLLEFGANDEWGIFSKPIVGRVGIHCQLFYKYLIENGFICDLNYKIINNKANFIKCKLNNENKIILKYSFKVLKDPSNTFVNTPCWHPKVLNSIKNNLFNLNKFNENILNESLNDEIKSQEYLKLINEIKKLEEIEFKNKKNLIELRIKAPKLPKSNNS